MDRFKAKGHGFRSPSFCAGYRCLLDMGCGDDSDRQKYGSPFVAMVYYTCALTDPASYALPPFLPTFMSSLVQGNERSQSQGEGERKGREGKEQGAQSEGKARNISKRGERWAVKGGAERQERWKGSES